MRSRAPQFIAVVVALLVFQLIGSSQATFRPTPEPIVTAENESWYLSGQPITYAGNIYYPTGPHIFFNPYEMVRSGDFNGIPLYSRTTIEPYSIVYVPLAGRLMKPYERRRAGDIAGTVGSTVPSFPVARSSEPGDPLGVAQAPAPPTQLAPSLGMAEGVVASSSVQAPAQPAATTGTIPPPGPLVSARKPEGLDGMFVEYRDRRWFSDGPAVELDRTQFTRIGDYRGFPVYRKREDGRTIYVAVSLTAAEMIAPYSARR